MMRSNILKASLAAASLVAGLTACDADKLTEVNANPNAPEQVQSSSLFTNATVGVMQSLRGAGVEHGLSGVWTQHFSEIQYPEDDLSQPRNATIEFYWNVLYAGTITGPTTGSLNDYTQILRQSQGQPNVIGPTLVMRAFLVQVMTDWWGDIPFSEANRGSEIFTPKYDTQAAIYDTIYASLTAAAGMMTPTGIRLGEADPVYGDLSAAGQATAWTKLANSLHARAAIRLSQVDANKAKGELVKALAGPVFTSNADNAGVEWPGGVLANPLCLNWSDAGCGGTRDDQRVSKRLVDTLKVNNDPRLAAFAMPTGASQGASPSTCDITYRGYPNGLSAPTEINPCTGKAFSLGDYSRPTLSIRSADSPSWIMTYSELLFIQAEAAYRGWIPGNAGALYNAAITASMQQWGIPAADIAAYLARPQVAWQGGATCGANCTAAASVGMRQLAYEKWVSLYNNETEAYSEWRRLDSPVLKPGPNQDPQKIPTRLPYPDIENSLNATNLAAAKTAQGGEANTTIEGKVWWDKP